MSYASLITVTPDFPIPGILFRDFGPLFADANAVHGIVNDMLAEIKKMKIKPTKLVLLESRGYIIGSILAHLLNAGIVTVRKPGKLPGKTYKVTFDVEYKQNECFELQDGLLSEDDCVLIHDDVLATGGTAEAAVKLCLMAGVKKENIGLCFLSKFEGLDGDKKLEDYEHFSLLSFKDK